MHCVTVALGDSPHSALHALRESQSLAARLSVMYHTCAHTALARQPSSQDALPFPLVLVKSLKVDLLLAG